MTIHSSNLYQSVCQSELTENFMNHRVEKIGKYITKVELLIVRFFRLISFRSRELFCLTLLVMGSILLDFTRGSYENSSYRIRGA